MLKPWSHRSTKGALWFPLRLPGDGDKSAPPRSIRSLKREQAARSFAREQAGLFQGMQAVLLQGRCPGHWKHLAGIGNAERVERGTQPLEAIDFVRAKHIRQEIAFFDTHPMFAGDRAAALAAHGQHF